MNTKVQAKPERKYAYSVARAGLLLLVVSASILLATGLYWLLHEFGIRTRDNQQFTDPTTAEVFHIGLQLGIGVVLGFVVAIGTPLVWRQLASPVALRAVALGSSLLLVVSGTLLIPPPLLGWPVAALLALAVTVVWWQWQERWSGTGVAPSALSGVLRPHIHPGQLWFAYLTGVQEDKQRPILVLKPVGGNRWLVAYFTTQEPPATKTEEYLPVLKGTLRGLDRDQWLRVTDLRALRRNAFRTYVGLASTGLYDQACEVGAVKPDTAARTVDEDHAGAGDGPFERAWRQSLGVYRPGEPRKSAVDDRAVTDVITHTVRNLWRNPRK